LSAAATEQGPVVIDTMVLSALLDTRPSSAGPAWRGVIGASPTVLSFCTVTEVRYGALRAGWGQLRRARLERDLARFVVIRPDDRLMGICAELRHRCAQRGHPLGQKVHEADRWVAATAVALDIELVSDDTVFDDVEGLRLRRRA
jgi:predicted nucleic acid-binding protein